jgi:hypothetical protein
LARHALFGDKGGDVAFAAGAFFLPADGLGAGFDDTGLGLALAASRFF